MIKVSNALALVSDEVQKLVCVSRVQAKVIVNWSFFLEVAVILTAFYGYSDSTDAMERAKFNLAYKE